MLLGVQVCSSVSFALICYTPTPNQQLHQTAAKPAAVPAAIGVTGGTMAVITNGPGSNAGGGTFGAAADAGAATTVVQFGANPNQIYHTFRHIIAGGMNQGAVQTAIQADVAASSASLSAGLNIRTIIVAGKEITYNLFKHPDGLLSVGRITLP